MQAKVPTKKETDEERTMDTLYIGPKNNGTGYYVFMLKTKEKILMPKVTPIPMPKLIINVVNEMGTKEGEVEDIQFGNLYNDVTIDDIEI